jgi:hypothetical protein
MTDFYLQLTGKTSIEGAIDPDKELSVAFKRLDTYKEEKDTQTGDITYKAKNLDIVTIIQGDRVLKGQPKNNSQSKKLRSVLFNFWEQQHAGEVDFETFYQKTMSEIIEEWQNKLV